MSERNLFLTARDIPTPTARAAGREHPRVRHLP